MPNVKSEKFYIAWNNSCTPSICMRKSRFGSGWPVFAILKLKKLKFETKIVKNTSVMKNFTEKITKTKLFGQPKN
jgi:hypothetical protein